MQIESTFFTEDGSCRKVRDHLPNTERDSKVTVEPGETGIITLGTRPYRRLIFVECNFELEEDQSVLEVNLLGASVFVYCEGNGCVCVPLTEAQSAGLDQVIVTNPTTEPGTFRVVSAKAAL